MKEQISVDVKPCDILDFFQENKPRLHDFWWLANAIKPQCRARRRGWTGGTLMLGQDPSEFALWLIMLSRNSVKSYTEIGCWAGGSLYIADSYMRATVNGYLGCCGIDRTDKRLVGFDEYKARHKTVEFKVCDTQSEHFEITTEAAFVDGDHAEVSMLNDYSKCSGVKKLIGFHDIFLPVGGCPAGWSAITKREKTSEIATWTEKRRWMKGIGVVYKS